MKVKEMERKRDRGARRLQHRIEGRSVLRIQCQIRMHLARKVTLFLRHARNNQAAILIQRRYRNHRTVQIARAEVERRRRLAQQSSASLLQYQIRCHFERKAAKTQMDLLRKARSDEKRVLLALLEESENHAAILLQKRTRGAQGRKRVVGLRNKKKGLLLPKKRGGLKRRQRGLN